MRVRLELADEDTDFAFRHKDRTVHHVLDHPRIPQFNAAAKRLQAFQLQFESRVTLKIKHHSLWLQFCGQFLRVLRNCVPGSDDLLGKCLAVPDPIVSGRHPEFTTGDLMWILVMFGRSRLLREQIREISHSLPILVTCCENWPT